MESLRGRTALVTGATGGIGRELVRALLHADARVMAADIDDFGLRRLEETIAAEGLGQRLVSRHLDISDRGNDQAAISLFCRNRLVQVC